MSTEPTSLGKERAKRRAEGLPVPGDVVTVEGTEVLDSPVAQWAPPLPLAPVTSLPEFPVECLPPYMATFVHGVAEATQTPPEMCGMLALAAVSTLIARKVVIEARPGWREPTNIYTATVLPPGERKTAVFQAVTEPLETIEETLIEQARTSHHYAVAQRRADERAARQAEQEAARLTGDERMESVARAADLQESLDKEGEPALPRLIADDATPEAVISLMARHCGRIAVLSDEGGIFGILAGRYSTNGAPNLEAFLKAHAGSSIHVDRKGREPEHVKRPSIVVGLTVQPEVLRALGEQQAFAGRGLLARFLWTVPRSRVGHRDTAPKSLSREVGESWGAGLQQVQDNYGSCTEHVVTLSEEAAARFAIFEKELEPRLGPGGDLEAVTPWASKLAGAVLRFAAILLCAQPAQHAEPPDDEGLAGSVGCALRQVDDAVMARAITLGKFLVPHSLVAFDAMGDSNQTMTRARRLVEWIRRTHQETFSARDAFDQNRSALIRKADEVRRALDILVDHGWIRCRPEPPRSEQGGRPPSPIFDVNPSLPEQEL